MDYEFYADVFFLTNCYLDYLAVYAVSEILEQKKKPLRYFICSAFGSLAGCVLFLLLKNYDIYLLCMHFIVNPGMTFFCFFPAEKRIYGKAFCLMYFVILLLGGSVEWLYVTIAGRCCYELCIFFVSAPLFLFLYILRRKRKSVQRFYQVVIWNREMRVALTALYDTGNSLFDPYIREPVHIISKELYETLGGENAFPVRLIPFSSVGCKNGMLKAFTIEGIRVTGEDGEYEISPAALALAEDAVFQNRAYQMILNCKTIERKEEKICT